MLHQNMVDNHNYALAEMLENQKGNVLRSSWDGPLTNRLQQHVREQCIARFCTKVPALEG